MIRQVQAHAILTPVAETEMLKSVIAEMLNKPVRVVYDNRRVFEGVLETVDNMRDYIVVRGVGMDDVHNLIINVERIIDIFLT